MAPTASLLLAVAALLISDVTAATSQEPPATPCAAAIVSFSPCLAHVAVVAPPVRHTPTPTTTCCSAFLRAVSTGDGDGGGTEGCFCHLLRDPHLLGFPVDTARLSALLPTCASPNASTATTIEAEALFADKCQELNSLPEMHMVPASPPPTPKISPAAVPGPAPPVMVPLPSPSVPVLPSRSGLCTFCVCWVFLLAFVLPAAVLITLQLC